MDNITKQEPASKAKKGGMTEDFFSRLGVLGELMGFLWKRKQYWLIPMLACLLIFAVIILLGSSTPVGAFIYTLF